MKTTVSGLLFFFALHAQIFSQSFYLKVQGGYGIASAPGIITSYNNDSEGGTYSTESKDYSLGQGTYYSLIAGYFVNDNAAIDLEFNYHASSAINSYENNKIDQYDLKSDTEIAGTVFSIIPSLLLTTEFLSFNPYLKVGAILSFPGITEKSTTHITSEVQSSTQYVEYSYTGGISFGVASAIGLMYGISDGINISLEVNNKNISYSPKEGKLEKATLDGVTILEYFPPESREFKFKDTTENGGSMTPGYETAAVQYPFSSLSFLMGVSIEL